MTVKLELRYLFAVAAGSFLATGFINYLGFFYDTALLFPSFASSAVVLFVTSRLTLRQVKSVLGGQMVSALVGVTIYKIFGLSWWTISLGVSAAIVIMILTDTIHPPGGATAFAAIFLQQNYTFVVKPVFFGMALLVLIALMIQFCKDLRTCSYPKNIKTSFSRLKNITFIANRGRFSKNQKSSCSNYR